MGKKEFYEVLNKVPKEIVDEFKNDKNFTFIKSFLEKNECPHSKNAEYRKDAEKFVAIEKLWSETHPDYGFIPVCVKTLTDN